MTLSKNLFCLTILLCVTTISALAQKPSDNPQIYNIDKSEPENNILTTENEALLSKLPTFQGGGLEEFRIWIIQNLRYPEDAQENNVQGRVVCSFVITTQGKIGYFDILFTPDRSLSQEVIRVLLSSPAWTPGIDKNGNPVAIKHTIPIDFKLKNDSNDTKYKSDKTRNDTSYPENNYAQSSEGEDQLSKFPSFKGGGLETYRRWVAQNLIYPEVAQAKNIEGTVILSFVLSTKGKVEEITVLHSDDHSLAAEAVLVVRLSPAWTPGIDKNGNPIRVHYTMPIEFRLTNCKTGDAIYVPQGSYDPRYGFLKY